MVSKIICKDWTGRDAVEAYDGSLVFPGSDLGRLFPVYRACMAAVYFIFHHQPRHSCLGIISKKEESVYQYTESVFHHEKIYLDGCREGWLVTVYICIFLLASDDYAA